MGQAFLQLSADWPIRRMSHIVDRHSQILSRELRPLGLTAPMWRILNGLHEGGPSSIADLAAHAAIERSYVSRVVARLAKLKLVAAQGDKTDRRFLNVTMTVAGKELHQRAKEIVVRINAESMSALKAEEVAELQRFLAKIATTVGAASSD